MKPIHLILSIALLAGGACGDQQEPYYGNSEVKMPQIDSEWNLELMPNRSGQYWKVFVYKDLKYNAFSLGRWAGMEETVCSPLVCLTGIYFGRSMIASMA